MGFTSGMEALRDAIDSGNKKADSARQGGTGQSLNYFNWKPGDKKILRFLADDVITGEFYDFILDRTGQTKNFMVDPDDPRRLHRYMSPTPGIGWKQDYQTRDLVDPKVRKMTVGVAVLRHEVPGSDGKGLVVEDFLAEKDVDGKKVPSRHFGIVQQAIPNFWRTMANFSERYGTICDRDYEITRSGGGPDTTYSIIPIPGDDTLSDPEVVKSFYFYGSEWDANDPERFLKCPMTTLQWAKYFSGEERYSHWLSPEAGSSPPPTFAPPAADEAQAITPSSGSTSFSSLQETLLKNASSSK